jgi:hypothetical protein
MHDPSKLSGAGDVPVTHCEWCGAEFDLDGPPSTPPSRPAPVADAGGVGIEPETHGEWRAAEYPEPPTR